MRNKLEELIPQEWLGKNRKAELIEILLPLFNVRDSNQWTCDKCGTVPNEEVTFEETHDGCGGYCS